MKLIPKRPKASVFACLRQAPFFTSSALRNFLSVTTSTSRTLTKAERTSLPYSRFFRLFSYTYFLGLLFPSLVFGSFCGNPALPSLQNQGREASLSHWNCWRIGYVADFVYQQRYTEEFHIGDHTPLYAKFNSNAVLITFNAKDWLDIYAMLGSGDLQIDREVFTNRQFLWGIGSKFLLHRGTQLLFGFDLKYVMSQQKPVYFLSEGQVFAIESKYRLNYSEMQAALGFTYRATPSILPYLWGTYCYTQIEPNPPSMIVQPPSSAPPTVVVSRSAVGKRRWGLSLGCTLLGSKNFSLTGEARLFNQNAYDLSGELLF